MYLQKYNLHTKQKQTQSKYKKEETFLPFSCKIYYIHLALKLT